MQFPNRTPLKLPIKPIQSQGLLRQDHRSGNRVRFSCFHILIDKKGYPIYKKGLLIKAENE